MSGNYYSIDIWGLLIALVMVAVAAGISEAMRMGIGKTLLWSACRALLQLCAMGFIMEFVIKSNNPWLVLFYISWKFHGLFQCDTPFCAGCNIFQPDRTRHIRHTGHRHSILRMDSQDSVTENCAKAQ